LRFCLTITKLHRTNFQLTRKKDFVVIVAVAVTVVTIAVHVVVAVIVIVRIDKDLVGHLKIGN